MKFITRALVLGLFTFYACGTKTGTKVTSTPAATTPPSMVQANPTNPTPTNATSSGVGLDMASKVSVDATVRTGMLPNGMSYYIKQNAKPEDRVELRLAIKAGSILEDNDQLGVAHFVEHMAFNGSTNFKKQELVDYLESVGTRFGADLNAYTSFDETVYMLQARSDEEDKLMKGLLVMEDWASGVAFDPTEIDKERGVVESEWRTGLSPFQRISQKTLPLYLYGSHYADRLPIGKPEIIETVSYDAVKRFYKDWYRPELMAIIAVGDLDLDKMEMELKTRFSKIPSSPASARARTKYEVPLHEDTKVLVATDKEAPYTQIQVINKFTKKTPATVQDYRNGLLVNLYNSMIGARISELSQKPNPPFNFANSGYGDFLANLNAYSSFAVTNEGGALHALEAILIENERAARHGFTTSEFERQKEELMRQLESAVKEKDKTESGNIASSLVANFLEQEFIMSPEQELDLARKLMPTVDLFEINLLPKKWIVDKGRVITISGPEKDGLTYPSNEEINKLVAGVKTMDIPAYEDKVSNEALISQDLVATDIVSEKANDQLGTKEIKLKNGVTVVLKKTDYKNDEILMSAFSPGGGSQYSDADEINASFASDLVSNAGLGKLDEVQLQKRLTGKIVRVAPYITNTYEGLNGSASPQDLELMFQLIYLYFTEPRKDLDAYQSFVEKQKGFVKNLEANPQYYFIIESNRIKTQNHPREKMVPSMEDFDKLNFDRAYEIYKDRFADASDFTFTFVGNFDENEIKMFAREYLGNLPSNGRKEMWKDLGVRKPTGVVTKSLTRGEAPKSYVDITYHGAFDWDDQNRYQLTSMIDLLRIKLREALREDKGGVYGVSVNGGAQLEPIPTYTMNISFNCDPPRTEELIQATQEVLNTARSTGIDDKDLQKVTETQRQTRIKQLKENRFWMGQTQNAYQYKINPNNILLENLEQKIKTLNADAIKADLAKYLNESNKITITMQPDKKSN